MKIRYTPLRFLTRGLGGPAAALLGVGILTFPIIIDEIRKKLGRSQDDTTFEFDDDINIYKITALLKEINQKPLNNSVYNKMTKMIVEKKMTIDVELVTQASKKSDPYKIVIGEYSVKRGYDE